MRRILCLLLSMLLLSCTAIAESDELCQHEFALCESVLSEHDWIVEGGGAEAFLASARCTLCGETCVILKDGILLEPEPCEPEVCTHRMYTLPSFNRTVWLPATDEDGEAIHQRVEYDVGVCLDCGVVATVSAFKETGSHQMVEKPGFHVEGQYIHAACQECLLCGLMTGALVPCVTYEDGSCDRLPVP